jgi:hypothetical protein
MSINLGPNRTKLPETFKSLSSNYFGQWLSYFYQVIFKDGAAIDKAKKSEQQVKEILNKYPSSKVIKVCVDQYHTVVSNVKVSLIEEPSLISLDIQYAMDSLEILCQ